MGTLIGRFYQAIRNGGAPPVSLDEACEVVRVTDWIWRQLSGDGSSGRSATRAALEV
jgi:hypothetical protein